MFDELFALPQGSLPPTVDIEKLNDLERRVLQILSFYSKTQSKTSWIRTVHQVVDKLPLVLGKRPVTQSKVRDAINTLDREGYFSASGIGYWSVKSYLQKDIIFGAKQIPTLLRIISKTEHPSNFFRYDSDKAGLRACIIGGDIESIKDLCNLTKSYGDNKIYDLLLPELAFLSAFELASEFLQFVPHNKRELFYQSGPLFLTIENYKSWLNLLKSQGRNLPEYTVEATCSVLHFVIAEREIEAIINEWMPSTPADFFLELKKGETAIALEKGEQFFLNFQEDEGHKRKELPGLFGLLYAFVLLKSENKTQINLAGSFVRSCLKINKQNPAFCESPYLKFTQAIVKYCGLQSGKLSQIEGDIYRLYKNEEDQFFGAIVSNWIGKMQFSFTDTTLDEKQKWELHACGYTQAGQSEANSALMYEELKEKFGSPLAELFQPVEPWEDVLKLLAHNIEEPSAKKQEKAVPQKRLIWYIDPMKQDHIQPIIQTKTKQGWDKGKEKSLRALVKDIPDFATIKDHSILSSVHSDRYGTYILNWKKLIQSLVGNDQLYTWYHPHLPLEITQQEAQLEINQTSKGATISISAESPMHFIEQESETRFVYILWTKTLENVYHIISAQENKKVTIPNRDLKKASPLLSLIGKSMPVSGNLVSTGNGKVKSENIPVIQLTPINTHLHVQILIEPIDGESLQVVPGVGAIQLNFTDKAGNKLQVERNKACEKRVKKQLIENISFLADITDSQSELFLDEDEQILDFLSEIRVNAPEVKVIWPKGERLQVPKVVSYSDMSMGVKEKHNWFEIGGHIRISDTKKLSIQELLDQSKGGQLKYVALDEKTFLGIESGLRRKLKELDAVIQKKGGKIGVHPLGTNAVESLLQSVPEKKSDKGWKQHIKNLDSLKAYQPQLPKNIEATLRPYQEAGFQWLDRLHQWGVGACLADDMGLGKTIQSIALLAKYGNNGPSLVVAPSSVCSNWKRELNRFAPTLGVKELKLQNREDTLKELQNNEVLIVSYGIIQSNPDLLSIRKWNIAILDEAHAIKNSKSIRSKAVMKLSAKFKMITTGTPIQNHLGELWNLFQFINPDMLGTYDSFIKRYVQFENDGKSHQNRKALNRYLSPFILRRNKSEVLDDLPEKTEITLNVTLSHEERAMYETIRSQAVESIEKSKEKGAPKHIQILSEITKLRQVSCNPKLVVPKTAIESSKLQALENLVEDLLNANHKALIFSQFTKHLDLIRSMVEKKGISYQYLDGSISTKQRDKAINAFQSGESELFLISLKAGGVGLNLTAADYVIHMDPWWNPAIEDQASDRAHRIGQTRPVTIYRIIAEDTIEEKIVKMHHDKRNIADQLLANTDQAAKISSSELFDLLKK